MFHNSDDNDGDDDVHGRDDVHVFALGVDFLLSDPTNAHVLSTAQLAALPSLDLSLCADVFDGAALADRYQNPQT